MKNYIALVKEVCTTGETNLEGMRYLGSKSLTYNLSAGDFPLDVEGPVQLKDVVAGLHDFLEVDGANGPTAGLVCAGDDSLTLSDMMDALAAMGQGSNAHAAIEPWRLHTTETLAQFTSAEQMRAHFDSQYTSQAKDALYQMLCEKGLLKQVPGTRPLDRVNDLIEQFKHDPISRGNFVVAWASEEPMEGSDTLHSFDHVMFKFSTTALTLGERLDMASGSLKMRVNTMLQTDNDAELAHALRLMDEHSVPAHKLNCEFYRRSTDLVKEVPLDIARYALLTCVMAKLANLVPGEFTWSGGVVVVADEDLAALDGQLSREPAPLSVLWLNDAIDDVATVTLQDVDLFVA